MDRSLKAVEKLPTALVISVGAHAVLIAWVVVRVSTAPERTPDPPAPTVTIEVVDIEPTPVMLLDEIPAVAPVVVDVDDEPIVEEKRTTQTRATIATATTTATTASTTEVAPTTEETGALRMRGPGSTTTRVPNLTLSEGFREQIAKAPAGGGSGDERIEKTGKLRPSGGGTHRSDEGVFTAKVDKDGQVSIKDKRNFTVKLKVPGPKQIGNAVTDWYRSDKGNDGKRGERTLGKNVQEGIDPADGTETVVVPVVGGGFDVTDALLRRKKQDPYFSKKLRYLDSTRDERVAIGSKYKQQQLKQSGELMVKSLAQLPVDPVARRAALFELWDDCAETGEPAIVEGGRAARAIVFGHIRAKHPKGSPTAFTAAELAAFNQRRQSKTVFAPYEE